MQTDTQLFSRIHISINTRPIRALKKVIKMTLTTKAINVLTSISRGASTREDIAAKLATSVPTVNGSLNALKRNGLVEDHEGTLSITPDAKPFLAKATPSTNGSARMTKMAAARSVFAKNVDKGRQFVLNLFRDSIGLTAAGASTYYQTLRQQNEHAGLAFQKSRKSNKVSTMTRVKATPAKTNSKKANRA